MLEASAILEKAEKVLSDYQEQIKRGYYLETCVVRKDAGDKAKGVLYLFIIDIPSRNKRYVMSFGFGDLAWGRTRWNADYPPDGQGGTWLTSGEWGTIDSKTSSTDRMNMLKANFLQHFPDKTSVVNFLDAIKSNQEWNKRIGIYEMNIPAEKASVEPIASTVQSPQQGQQGLGTLSSTQAHIPQQYSNPPYLDGIGQYEPTEKVYIELSLKLLHSTDEQLKQNPITLMIVRMLEDSKTSGGNILEPSFSLIRYIFGLILFEHGMFALLTDTMDGDDGENSISDIQEQVESVYKTVGISSGDTKQILRSQYYVTKPPLSSITHNFIVDYSYQSGRKDDLLIKYMETTAKKYPQGVLSVKKYDQRTLKDFFSIMESFNQDSDDYPLKYSYVNIKNDNNDLLYIFILIPGIFRTYEEIEPQYYENVEFQLICILESGEQKQFMFPINTRLLFWCSSPKEAGTGTSSASEGTAQLDHLYPYRGGTPNPPRRYRETNAYQTRPPDVEEPEPDVEEPEKSFIEKIKEYYSGYKTNKEPFITIPPLNFKRDVLYKYEGFNSDNWRSETLKYCKIDAINAQVNVKK